MKKHALPSENPIINYEPALPHNWGRAQNMEAPQFFEAAESDTSSSLAAYWQILRRRRRTVLAVATIILVGATIASFKMKPVYKGTARLEVESDSPQGQALNDNYQQMQTDPDFLRTQIQILETDSLAWRTVEQLGLAQDRSFSAGEDKLSTDPDVRKMELIRRFKKDLTAELIQGSRVISVDYESTDPRLAARITNALVDNYKEYNFRQKYDAARQAAGRMEQQLDELKAKVEKSQQDLVEYERKYAITNTNDKQSVVEQRLGELTSDLTQSQNDRIAKEALYTQVKNNPDQIPAVVQSDLLQRLREKSSEMRNQYVEALNQYGPAYPKVVRLQKQVTEAESQITTERQRFVERIKNDYFAARDRERLLTDAVARQKEELGTFNRTLVVHNLLKGEFDTNQQLYQRLLQHLKDATVTAGLRSTNVHTIDSALVPTIPVRPNKRLYVSLGLGGGLLVGVLIAFVQEALDSSLKSPEDIEALISMPALALIPGKTNSRSSGFLRSGGANVHENGTGNREIALLQNSNSPLAEAYRTLRTSVLLSLASRAPQSILLTSADVGEGKTSTAVNLAIAMAQCGVPVVLVDCDLRKPTIARTVGVDNQRGMSTYLTGNDTLEDVLQQAPQSPNLWVISSGPMPPNPAELVSSHTMSELLQQLQGRFKHVIVDSPPVLAVTDATILSTLVDGVILVVESGVTPKKVVARAYKTLENAGAQLLGVALNKVKMHHDGYYGTYGGYYYRSAKPADEVKQEIY